LHKRRTVPDSPKKSECLNPQQYRNPNFRKDRSCRWVQDLLRISEFLGLRYVRICNELRTDVSSQRPLPNPANDDNQSCRWSVLTCQA